GVWGAGGARGPGGGGRGSPGRAAREGGGGSPRRSPAASPTDRPPRRSPGSWRAPPAPPTPRSGRGGRSASAAARRGPEGRPRSSWRKSNAHSPARGREAVPRVQSGAVERGGRVGGGQLEQLAVDVLAPRLLGQELEDRDRAGDRAVEAQGDAGRQVALVRGRGRGVALSGHVDLARLRRAADDPGADGHLRAAGRVHAE